MFALADWWILPLRCLLRRQLHAFTSTARLLGLRADLFVSELLMLGKFSSAVRTNNQIVTLGLCFSWQLVRFTDANVFKIVIFVGIIRLDYCDLGFCFSIAGLFTQSQILLWINSFLPFFTRWLNNVLLDNLAVTQVINSFWTGSFHHFIQLLWQVVVRDSSRSHIAFRLLLNFNRLGLFAWVWKPTRVILGWSRTSGLNCILGLQSFHHLLHLLHHHTLIW
jgi:hypothetical protein